ncbi:hypothetical protein H6F51_05920 [Cyanobacteria bacterium FACHB-DQ100]|nr:hypothetical protein [Cyanobacteria bacterium FACHB-DQ100]
MKDRQFIRHFRISTFWMRCFAVTFVLAGFGGVKIAAANDSSKIASKVAAIALEVPNASWLKPAQEVKPNQKVKPEQRVKPAVAAPTVQGAAIDREPKIISRAEFLQQKPETSAEKLLNSPSVADSPIAQAPETGNSQDLRRQLLIEPLEELRIPAYSPGSTVGVPSAFGANFGDAFVGLFFANRRPRINEADSALSFGFGLGDSERELGLEVNFNIGSLRRFGANGEVGLKLHRSLPGKAAIALGFDSGIRWGDEASRIDSSLYGVASKIFDLRPGNVEDSLPLTLTLGVGGGRFRSYDNTVNGRGGVGVFASAGLRVVPQASVIGSWTGQDLNLGVSYVPIKTTPLFLTFVVGNVLNRNDNNTVFSFSVGYGFNYLGYQY